MNKMMNILMLSCEKATNLIEKRLVTKLTSVEKIQLKMHTKMCKSCEMHERESDTIEKSRILIDYAPIGIALFNSTDGTIIDLNSKFAEIAGRTIGEMLGLDWMSITHPDDLSLNLKNISLMNNGEVNHFNMEKRFIRADNSVIWINITIVPIKVGHTMIKKHLAMIEDISKRKQYEIDIEEKNIKIIEQNNNYKEINKKLVMALEKAEESDRLKSAFLANMSHEIRTPMSGILGFSDLLKTPNLTPEKQQKYIDIIEKSGKRMLVTINDIMDISKIESGLMSISLTAFNSREKSEEIFNFFKLEAEKKGIELLLKNKLTTEDEMIKSDHKKVYSIITNLVKNAIKFTNTGSVEFGFATKEGHLEFYIKDTGIGIPKNRQAFIFDRFVQADIEDKLVHQGSGLGLAISKSYVEMLGGKIWLTSEVGKGSEFYFTIPYQKSVPNQLKIVSINPS